MEITTQTILEDYLRNNLDDVAMMYTMMTLQDHLNAMTNGTEWIDGYTKEGRSIDWERCIRQEGAEFIDSFNWKHWKDINTHSNLENAKMELVDIWHFILSMAVEKELLPEQMVLWFDAIAKKGKVYHTDLIRSMEFIIQMDIDKYFNKAVQEFGWLAYHTGLTSISKLFELYVAKNWLNLFRQENGYKEGTYQKHLLINDDLVEDNEVLMMLIESFGLKEALEEFRSIYENRDIK